MTTEGRGGDERKGMLPEAVSEDAIDEMSMTASVAITWVEMGVGGQVGAGLVLPRSAGDIAMTNVKIPNPSYEL